MTTMFVQLRRVVYLLVLLQCCVCAAYGKSGTKVEGAEPSQEEGNETEVATLDAVKARRTVVDIPTYTTEEINNDKYLKENNNRDFRQAVAKVMVDIKGLSTQYSKGVACLKALDKVVEESEKTVEKAEEATEKIKKLTQRIDKITEKRLVEDGKGTGKEMKVIFLKDDKQKEEFENLLKEIPEALEKAKGKGPDEQMVVAIAQANHTREVCRVVRINVDDVLGSLNNSLNGLIAFPQNDYDKCEMAVRVRDAGKAVHDTMKNVTALMSNVTVFERIILGKAEDQVKDWKSAMEKFELFAQMVEAYNKLDKETQAKVKDGEALASNKEYVVEKGDGLEKIKETVKGPKEEIDNLTDKNNEIAENKKTVAVGKINKTIYDEIDKEDNLLAEEKVKIQKEKEEAARREKEERRRQEEERQKQAAAAEAEAQRIKEEQERKKREEQAKKERDEQAKRDAEEEAKRAVEEKALRDAEKAKAAAKKKRDGAVSPALVHSPLLLLVLCVLGCTFVC
ncbi:uncharacterized protein TM35_000041280 [Trypanosoma theileri]|uniref:Uncharacterized protein n=1 Tax=Trypanosoma theileri TaxID=67003 RepID=A0A1X0P4P3_9TRYP|nr:uncharacterized protein TM35_000041280 [Trypanosoma theileri]ORC91914.1 hypothetical protein TM35_000041280 [Trypanosoma theileri]